MKLTTKGRYAVMAMADLALFKDNGPTSLSDISLRQNISLAYLEQIFIKLKDNNLVIEGSRVFTLINPEWNEPHHIIYLNRAMGALQIPVGTYHRSISNKEGSIVLNQAVRDEKFNPENEFIPISLRDRKDLQEAQKKNPVYWVWEKDQIKRIKLDPIQSKEKVLNKL